MESVTGSGLLAETPCRFPLPSMIPISVALPGAATPVVPTEGLLAEILPVTVTAPPDTVPARVARYPSLVAS